MAIGSRCVNWAKIQWVSNERSDYELPILSGLKYTPILKGRENRNLVQNSNKFS